jgi:heat shock protein HtpX
MAHELTHVQNRDVLVMTLASFFATIAAYIMQFGLFFGGGHSSDDDDNPSILVLFAVSFFVYVISFFLMQALSRYREFSADRGAGAHHGPAERARIRAGEDQRRHAAHPGQGPARAGRAGRLLHLPARRGKALGSLFSTHPPMEKRIAALGRLESQLQGTVS